MNVMIEKRVFTRAREAAENGNRNSFLHKFGIKTEISQCL